MEFKEVIQKRYSCKKYSDRQVEKEKLESYLRNCLTSSMRSSGKACHSD